MSQPQNNQPASQLFQDIEEFLIDRQARNLSAKTLSWYSHSLKLFTDYSAGHGIKATTAITPQHIRRFLIYLQKDHNEGGVHNIFGALRSYLRWFATEYTPEGWPNPLAKVETPKRTQELEQPITLDDFKLLIATCESKTFTGDRDKAMLLFLLDSGVRHQELTDLQVGDVDLNTGQVIVKRGKGRKGRVVFIGAKTKRALLAYFRHYPNRNNDSPLWLTRDREQLSKSGIREIVRRRALQAGIDEPGLHDFRRAFALNYLRNGGDVITLQRLLGHANLTIINRYLNLLADDLKAGIAKHGVVDNM